MSSSGLLLMIRAAFPHIRVREGEQSETGDWPVFVSNCKIYFSYLSQLAKLCCIEKVKSESVTVTEFVLTSRHYLASVPNILGLQFAPTLGQGETGKAGVKATADATIWSNVWLSLCPGNYIEFSENYSLKDRPQGKSLETMEKWFILVIPTNLRWVTLPIQIF